MNKEIWLWLLLVMLPHNPRTMQLVEEYESVRAAAEAVRDNKCVGLTNEERERAVKTRTSDVTKIIVQCESAGIRIITFEDAEYPELLRNIYNPPIVLFVQGTLETLKNRTCLAVVGTREPSVYSVRAAEQICSELSKLDLAIISGAAVGIDTTAHSVALLNGAKTVAVLACGNLVNYPSASHALKQNIIRSGGAVISELLPNTGVTPGYFMHRNRIISGLAHGTFVVQAGAQSGSLLTAEHTVQQGRELFCLVPHDIFSQAYAGVVPLIRDGAIPVFGYEDIAHGLKYNILLEL